MTVVRSGGDPDGGQGGDQGDQGGRSGPGGGGSRGARAGRQAWDDGRDAWDTREGDAANATSGEAGSADFSGGLDDHDDPPAWDDERCGLIEGPSHLAGSHSEEASPGPGWPAPEDRPWTPIPRPARPVEAALIPAQRRLKKTSRSA